MKIYICHVLIHIWSKLWFKFFHSMSKKLFWELISSIDKSLISFQALSKTVNRNWVYFALFIQSNSSLFHLNSFLTGTHPKSCFTSECLIFDSLVIDDYYCCYVWIYYQYHCYLFKNPFRFLNRSCMKNGRARKYTIQEVKRVYCFSSPDIRKV